jgi:2-dehydro-3-deoxy-D-pentonate aldolase
MAKIYTPVVTILNDQEKPDLDDNKKVIDFLVDGGVDGILVLGSAGEFPNLTVDERLEFYRFYAQANNGRVKLLAGTGCVSYADTLKLSRAVYDMGYEAAMVIGPYYFGQDQEKLFAYYDRLAKDLEYDFYLYNYPPRTGHSLAPETIARLCKENKNIIGLKDSVSEPGHTNMVYRALEAEKRDLAGTFKAYSGFDDQFLANIANGGSGCIGALSNIVPEIWHDLIASANMHDFDEAMKYYHFIQKLMPIYDMDSNCSLIMKKLMRHRGLDIDTRAVFPYNDMSDEIFEKAAKLMDDVIEEYQNAGGRVLTV